MICSQNTLLKFRFALVLAVSALTAGAAENPFLGRWALTLPGGGAGWLGITQEKGYYDGSILWGGGSVLPVDSVVFSDDQIHITRSQEVQRKDAAGKVVRTQRFTTLLSGEVTGDELRLVVFEPRVNGQGVVQQEVTGQRIAPLPAAPDLSRVKWGEEIVLLNGKDLTGWRLTNPKQANGWSVQGGILVNRPEQHKGQAHVSYGNLRTEREFEDFNLKIETRVPKGGNSGIYLRGIYEVQVADTAGRKLDSHNMGGIYSRITPTVSAEKSAGEWQTFDITLVDRHVTVVLNGQKIIDNQPLLGCTGGALWSDETRPGPIYLQGDHMAVDFRNAVLRPVLE